MNKKIFTLLAGTFLMLATVFSVSAQLATPTNPSYIDQQTLLLGDPVEKLVNGANNGYYHLKLDAIGDGGGVLSFSDVSPSSGIAGLGLLSDDLVLYLGKLQTINDSTKGTYPLFVDQLNDARANWPKAFSTSAPKAEESAAALWCTIVNDYNQGKNITFDFINKQQRDIPLEVEVNGFNTWGLSTTDAAALHVRSSLERGSTGSPHTDLVPGVVSGWEFAANYATTLDQLRPLVSYIKTDTAAVLCVEYNPNFYPPTDTRQFFVYIKIASADDIKNGLISNVAYFTLYQAEPFTISALDFNTMFGTKPDALPIALRKLIFEPDVTGTLPNIFSKDGLWAQPITGSDAVIYDIQGDTDLFSFGPPSDYLITYAPKLKFDTLGYIYLTNGAAGTASNQIKYLYVRQTYYTDTPSGTRYLDFGWRGDGNNGNLFRTGANAWLDSTLYGQTIWRLVYYPSGDSIYINPYQATYLPEQYDALGLMDNGHGGKLTWTDTLVQSSDAYTFRAGPDAPMWNLALDPASVKLNSAVTDWSTIDETTDQFMRMVARLKYGKNPDRTTSPPTYHTNDIRFLEFQYYHKLYVTLQDLTGPKVVTLGHGNETNYAINTRIHFGIYSPCATGGGSERTTIAPDLYLIRNKLGEYLHVPLFSATDSAVWVELEPDVHPEFLPSFQWIVHNTYPNSEYSPITLINREFDELKYENIILWNDWDAPFDFMMNDPYYWNDQDVNERVVDFGKHNTDDKTATFVKLSGKSKTDPFLGYTYIDPNESIVSLYAFKYMSRIDQRWINAPNFQYWDYPNTDTTIYVLAKDQYDKLFFQIDTVADAVGALTNYGYNPSAGTSQVKAPLVRLKRQAYRLVYEDPYKFTCYHALCLRNDLQGQYAIGTTGQYTDFLGKPVFHLRHYYHIDGDYDQAGFALVQKIDPISYSYSGLTPTAQMTAFLAYLTEIYGPTLSGVVRSQIDLMQETSLELGFFVASVDDQTAKLKAVLRADAATRVSTFQLELDDDPIYRRFNQPKDGNADYSDTPNLLKFFSMDNPAYELFENTGKFPSQNNYWEAYGQKNYLGNVNINQYPDASTAIYVDTAYINRGTGPIKPQYMLMVRPQPFGLLSETTDPGCVIFGGGSGSATTTSIDGYLRGYYLINATDSAKNSAGNIDDYDYIWDTKWERLVFTDAIHWNDTLYILDGADLTDLVGGTTSDGKPQLDMNKVDAAAIATDSKIIKVNLNDNTHKDVVFSMRLIERGADDFIIESESSDRIFDIIPTWDYKRTNSTGPIIAPCEGGWIKIQNGVPVISRSDVVFSMPNAFRMNVRLTTDEPVANTNVTAVAPVVIGNDGAVTVLNAAGKKIVISNILGQTVANTVLSSDNVTIAAPKGIVVVAIEGEAAVKALVK